MGGFGVRALSGFALAAVVLGAGTAAASSTPRAAASERVGKGVTVRHAMLVRRGQIHPLLAQYHRGTAADERRGGTLPRLGGPSSTVPPRLSGIISLRAPRSSLRPPRGSVASSPSLGGHIFTGLDRFGSGGSTPPDTQLAVGGGFVVENVNDEVSVNSPQTGAPVSGFPVGLKAWWCTVANQPSSCLTSPYSTTDPRVIFDPASGRFFATILFFSNSMNVSAIDLAVSTSSDPTGTWNVYTVQGQASGIYDQPKLAVSSDKVTVTANFYTSPTAFDHSMIYAIQASDVIAGNASAGADIFNINSRFNPVPAAVLTPSSTQWVVYVNGFPSQIGVIKLTGTPKGGGVSESENDTFIAGFSAPQGAAQPGGGPALDPGPGAYDSAVAYNGTVVAVGSDQCGSPGNVCARFDVYDTASSSVTHDLDLTSGGGSAAILYPAVTVDGVGNAWLSYSTMSSSQHASVVLGTWNGIPYNASTGLATNLAQGSQSYCDNLSGSSCTGLGQNGWNRWGDYAALVRDQTDPARVWAAGEYGATPSGQTDWGTVLAEATVVTPTPTLRSVGLLTFRTYDKGSPVVRGCTATVVDSPNRSTILTAAHCLIGSAAFGGGSTGTVTDLQFAPAHTGACWDNINSTSPSQVEVSQCGTNPFGVWYANSSDVYISKNYSSKTGTDDFAFVVLAPDPANGPVESVVGGFPISFDPNGGGPSDPEQAQTWRVSGYAADDINFTKKHGFGPFGCDASPSSHVTPPAGQFGELIGACSFIDPMTGQETGFQMPPLSHGLPFGSSGSPWTNALNSGTGAYTIGAEEVAGGKICTSGGGCDAVFGNVMGADAKTVFTNAGSASTPIRQLYSCSVGGNQNVTVSAQASEQETSEQLNLSKITYTVTNPTPFSVTVTGATVYVPDPDTVNAPYINGSAKIATSPGWSAGHDANGTFASFTGSMVVGPGATVSTPALSASYTESGPPGTAIAWHPGQASLTISSPTSLNVTCIPSAPLGNIARVKE
jgi:hypothetical protein